MRKLTPFVESEWRRKGLLWLLLLPISLCFRLLVTLRRFAYQAGILESSQSSAPLVVVGNIYTGGVGKTPFLIWLVRQLQAEGMNVAVVSRGYGGRSENYPVNVQDSPDASVVGDEPLMIYYQTNALVVVGPDRVAAVREIESAVDVDVIVADDGLQHYQLARDIEIAVSDSARKHGNGSCLPGGPLREPVSRLKSVDIHVVTGGQPPDNYTRRMLAQPYNMCSGATIEWSSLPKRVNVVSAISHPDRFFSMLKEQGFELTVRALPDHSPIQLADVVFDNDAPILVTEKDAVKMPPGEWENVFVCPLAVDVDPRIFPLIMKKIHDVKMRRENTSIIV